MLVDTMRRAWAEAPAKSPAGSSELDNLYLDAVASGGVVVDSLDSFSLGCSSSIPSTIVSCATRSGCTA